MSKFPFRVQTTYAWTANVEYTTRLREIQLWLTDNVGQPYNDWVTTIGDNDCLQVRFVNENDAVWFTLRWI